jgi:hypothetical protein
VLIGDVQLVGRKDQVLPRGDKLWIRGAGATELWLLAREPIGEAVFQVRSPSPDNRVRLEMGRGLETMTLGEGTEEGPAARATLVPDGPSHRGSRMGHPFVGHRLEVDVERGRSRAYTKYFPPNPCPDGLFGYDESRLETFFLGAELTYLGSREALNADVFGVGWEEVEVRPRVVAGQTFYARVFLRNTSPEPWRETGAAEIRLSYHWLQPSEASEVADRVVDYDGVRSDLPLPVEPGEVVKVTQKIEAPAEPGRYVLALDPVFEHVSWFSRRGVEPYRVDVTVVREDN